MIKLKRVNDRFVIVAICDICEEEIVTSGSKIVPIDVTGDTGTFSILCSECSDETSIKGADFGVALAVLAANCRVSYSRFIGAFRDAYRHVNP